MISLADLKAMMIFICSFSSVYCEVVRPAKGWFDLVKQVRLLSYRTACIWQDYCFTKDRS